MLPHGNSMQKPRRPIAWRDTRWDSRHSEGSRTLLIAIIILEPDALIVLDTLQCSGVHLVQDHAMDSI
jgi:hypothetical protein